jgi:predicted dehydrogenase
MKQVYESGDLGEVFAMESRVQGSHGIPGDWRGKKEHGGGMMLDWGVHLIDQILQITKERKIERIYCVFDHITNYEVDDGFKLDIYFEEGLVARVEVGTSHFISLPRHYMNGSNGTAIIRGWGKDCEVVCCKNWEDKDVIPVVTAAGLTKTMAPRNKDTITEYVIPSPKSDVHDFYRNYCLAVDGKAEQIVTHKELMRVMKVMEAAFESDAAGKPVDFNDTI